MGGLYELARTKRDIGIRTTVVTFVVEIVGISPIGNSVTHGGTETHQTTARAANRPERSVELDWPVIDDRTRDCAFHGPITQPPSFIWETRSIRIELDTVGGVLVSRKGPLTVALLPGQLERE